MSDTASVIIKAANFAAIKHKDQRRKDPDQTPYINHPIGVAQILTNVSNYIKRLGNMTSVCIVRATIASRKSLLLLGYHENMTYP